MLYTSLHRKTALSIALLATAFNIHAANQDTDTNELPTVVVTADFRNTDEALLSTSISVLTEDDINALALEHFDDIISHVPNLNFAGGTSRARFFQIRGIGERSQFSSPVNASVGFVVDHVDYSGIGSAAGLWDVAQVEVLKGPQGTLYGANALAGLINISTNDPVFEQQFKLSLTAAEYDTRSINLMFNQALTETIAARIAVSQANSDGYYKNEFLNKDDTNERDELTVRAKLLVEASEDWQLKFSLTSIDQDNGYDVFTLDNQRSTLSDEPGRDGQKTLAFSVQSDASFERFNLQLVAAAANSELEYSYDEDWTFTGFDPAGYTSFDQYLRDRDNVSLEARFLSNESSRIFNDSTAWAFGLYHLRQEEDVTRRYTFNAADFNNEYNFDSTAIYGQLDTDLNATWRLSWGGRIERRNVEYSDDANLNFKPSETLYGGKLALQYQLSDSAIWFTSIARGYKAGGFNTDGSLDADLREFDSEYLWELESGVKGNHLDGLLELRAAVFFDRRGDQQIKSSLTRPRPDGSTEFIDYIGNAAKGTNKGLEVESEWFLSEQFSINASAAYLDATFDKFIDQDGDDQSGRDQAQAPNYSYNVSFNWLSGPWSFSVAANGQDEFFFSDRHELKSTSRNLINANLQYQAESYSLRLWGRNLADKDYTTRGFGSFGNDPRNGYTTSPYVQFGEPRIIGLSFDYSI